MQTRRVMLAGVIGLPFSGLAAHAASNRNSRLLLCRLSLDRPVIRREGAFKLGASLEARLEYVRLFTPLCWGDERGFHLELHGPDGKTVEAHFHPPVPLPTPDMIRNLSSYHALDAGEQTGFSELVQAKAVFPAPGRYRLRAVYIPEPGRAGAPVQAIVFENGPVASEAVAVTVI